MNNLNDGFSLIIVRVLVYLITPTTVNVDSMDSFVRCNLLSQ